MALDVLEVNEEHQEGSLVDTHIEEKLPPREYKIVWRNVILYVMLHVGAAVGVYTIFFTAKIWTVVWAFLLYQLGALGVTCGAHRLWSHRSFKAKTPLKLLLVLFQTLSFQDSVIDWARNHRVHHKYSETDADPHNARRGMFYSHVGWLLCRLHPKVHEKRKQLDITDLTGDPILAFQRKYYLYLMPIICFLLPTAIPVYLWGETWYTSWYVNLFRYTFTLHITWLVNSLAHFYGHKPYDKSIYPAENLSVAILALGEGWHNYHHTFPWDYKTAELGKYSTNVTTAFIDFMAKIGWAYDLKTASDDIVKKRILRTGDGTHEVWGWGDKDQGEEERKGAVITHKISED